ncbi:efflux RND transporter periplasmic adaptor subunit [Pseudodesulfovibrio sp.]|uniref:efflux RND transporter periplasmic adaptor subunit n=1 Tax=Pseudodesulfovibrio sp. TaxID=2035812 RepID=UPI002607EEA2|nr:efflux RND transporter periplasmic adaptor subunit [Pseudodesulfovibrio sp.]MDD3312766.1 efflux RND transporter periplasmic adaptor subunit [Pseudodesulfovibrio sp.]
MTVRAVRQKARPSRIFCRYLALFGLLAALILSGCSEKKKQGRPPSPVKTVQAAAKDTPVSLMAVGNVKASNSVTIKSRVDGHILRIHFLDGDHIKAGQILYTIDPETYIYQQQGAQANVASDRATAEQAQKDFVRYKDLYEQQVISRDEFEQKLTAYQTARKAMESDAAQADIAKRNVHFTKITAPFDGIAGSTLLDEGNLVAADKDELVVIKTIKPSDVVFSIPGRDVGMVRSHFIDDDLTVLATPNAPGAQHATGHLTFVDNWINPDTGMINLKARFTNEDEKLWPGQFVTVELILSIKKDAVRIPAQAVQRGPEGKYVYVVEDGKAVMRPVVMGMRDDDEVVIEKGLQKDETVIIEGMLRLYPGATVIVRNDDAKPILPGAKPDQAGPASDAKPAGAQPAAPAPEAAPDANATDGGNA